MIGYTTVGTNDLARATHFYDELFGLFGAKRFFDTDKGVGWGVAQDKPMFSVLQPFDGQPASVGNGVMIGLNAENAAQVQALYTKALALGAKDEGAPGARSDGFYAAYFRDLDGNKLGVFCML